MPLGMVENPSRAVASGDRSDLGREWGRGQAPMDCRQGFLGNFNHSEI